METNRSPLNGAVPSDIPTEQADGQTPKRKSIEEILEEKGVFVWATRGSSMRPLLRTNRDVVEIRKVSELYDDGVLRVNDVALYKVPLPHFEGNYILHRVREVHDGYYIICGDNNVMMEHIPFDWVVGVMTGLTRKGKNIDLNGFFYRFYVKHWGGRYRRRMIVKRIGFFAKKPLRPIYRAIKRLVKR